jgi:hypothetical protein
MTMARRTLSMNQIVAWTVPLLLALLLIPTAPAIVTIVRNHLELRHVPATTTTTTIPASPASASGSDGATGEGTSHHANGSGTSSHRPTGPTTTTVATTTTTVAGSSSTTSSSGNSSTGDSTSDTSERHGVLAPPYQEVQEPVAAGTEWTVTLGGVASYSLVCPTMRETNNPTLLVVPSADSGCYVDITSDVTSPVTWDLEPVH